jgi:hypothetical protein
MLRGDKVGKFRQKYRYPLGIKNCLAVHWLARQLYPNNGREDDRKKVRPALGGEPAAREPGLGTGRGGDVTEFA